MTATTMSIKYFDTLEYVQKARELRNPEALAAYQVKKIESAIETAVQYVTGDTNNIHDEFNNKEVVTKGDFNLLKKDVGTLKENVNSLKEDVNSLKEDVHFLKVDVHLLKKDIDVVRQDINILRKDVTNEIDLKIENLHGRMLKYFIHTTLGIVGVLISLIGTLGGLMAHGFHWI